MNVAQICPGCGATLLKGTQRMQCPACGASWPLEQNIPSYDGTDHGHGEPTPETMRDLVALAREGHWLSAARAIFKARNPELYDYAADLNRASWIPLLPIGPASTVLDISSGLGAITHALALSYRHVVSVDSVADMLHFSRVRCDQEGLENVDLIHTTVNVLPFPEGTFDLIVLNGVLEWVHEWRSSQTPREAQLGVLRDLRRLLRSGGVLVIGSENRIGYTSFLRHRTPSPRLDTPMSGWLEPLYRRLRKPGFYRWLGDPKTGRGPQTRSPSGYLKLLRHAGFDSVDLWWPPNGYNSPHTLLRASNRAAIRAYCDSERRYKDRVHGYSLARHLRHAAVVGTRFIHRMFPDVILIATAATARERQPDACPSLLGVVEQHVSSESTSSPTNVNTSSRLWAESLTTHAYKNKAVIKLGSHDRAGSEVVKVANIRLAGAEILQQSHDKLRHLYSAFHGNDPHLVGSIPSPSGVLRTGSLLATIEQSARGRRFGDILLDRQYFQRRDRVRSHLDWIASWLVTSRPTMDALGAHGLFEPIPPEWLLPPDAPTTLAPDPSRERFTGAQHGDFYPENVFLDEKTQRLSVIDWDGCATGYPPLFDWFCLLTGLYYTHGHIRTLPKGQTVESTSFSHTYFEASWFSELVLSLSHRLCDSFGLDTAGLVDYFKLYIVVRYRQFLSHPELEDRHYWGPRNSTLYRHYYDLLLKNPRQCCFSRSA